MFEEMMRVPGLELMGGDDLPLPPGQTAPGNITEAASHYAIHGRQ